MVGIRQFISPPLSRVPWTSLMVPIPRLFGKDGDAGKQVAEGILGQGRKPPLAAESGQRGNEALQPEFKMNRTLPCMPRYPTTVAGDGHGGKTVLAFGQPGRISDRPIEMGQAKQVL